MGDAFSVPFILSWFIKTPSLLTFAKKITSEKRYNATVEKLATLACLVMGARVATDKVKLNTRGETEISVKLLRFRQIYVSI